MKRKRGQRGRPWLRDMGNGVLRWHYTSQKNKIPLRRKDGSFVEGKENEQEALQLFHEVQAVRLAPARGDDNLVKIVLDQYLQFAEKETSKNHFARCLGWFSSFCKRFPELTIGTLTAAALEKWWAEGGHKDRSSGVGRVTCFRCFIAALNWASSPRGGNLIKSHPLHNLRLPTSRSRGAKVVVSQDEHAKVLSLAPPDLRDVLVALFGTGTRPGNVIRVTAAHFDAENGLWRFGEHKTAKATGRELVVPLTDGIGQEEPGGATVFDRQGGPLDVADPVLKGLLLRQESWAQGSVHGVQRQAHRRHPLT